ncbi:Eco57I restriction-modification methylase domain-containing protein [Chryseobacterium takakiae]|uniref:site-specific DNA-methyltransferase (adenine-specific) n=1 Tax=Chryseobacterium takakiae TaxID=1302685 RepID=A0A1M4Z2R0_9FLAO|nr:N-6 DNA methylase [Chryseobacterium takakiae]SHF12331.1 N-6 DNA Methylase [Chryseobacterium takakiae]
MSLFQKTVINKYLRILDPKRLNEKWSLFCAHFLNPEIQENIKNSKEEQYQGEFLIDLFVNVLGYTKNPTPYFNLTTEYKNVKDSKKADGAITINEKVLAIIELKGTDTTDLGKIENQAFGYKNNQADCKYVITSNFEKLRFYIDNAIEFLEFNLFELNKEQFDVLYLCLAHENIAGDIPAKIKNESVSKEDEITKKLYKDYSVFKRSLFQDLTQQNPEYDQLELFKKSQKLLDRFLFLFFGEDRGLLPPNSVRMILEQWQKLKDLDEYVPLYDRFKKYFGYLNTGFKGKQYDVFAYNGGLFKPDEILNNITIDDDLLAHHTIKLADYNFASDVDVNILGHIFENSLNEIDEIKAQLEGKKIDKPKTKRKKDGVFYTPKYITKYIVENTVGKLCEEKKAEIGVVEEDYFTDKKRQQKTKLTLLQKLQDYRTWLHQITIIDPACGSGAFLNEALNFLIEEHKYIDELEAKLTGSSIAFTYHSESILENNLFGVDLNEESVEIAKLSLWLRTAEPNRKLNDLSNNIKCGNSLIDNPKIAGEKAFNWNKEFPQVFAKGGFDVVIGNPPYGIFISEKEKEYYNSYFPLTNYKTNLYILFIERMLQIFHKGVIHFIIPKSLLFNSHYKTIRKELLNKVQINEIHTITEKVFEDAEVGSSLLLNFEIKDQIDLNNKIKLLESETSEIFISGIGVTKNTKSQLSFLNIPNYEISIIDDDKESILQKLLKLDPIKDFFKLKNGLNPGNIKHILISKSKDSNNHKPIIWGKDIQRYIIGWSGDYVNYDENIEYKITLKDIKSKEGMKKQNRIDFALRNPELFENKKIVVRKTGDKLIACLDTNNYYFDTLVHGIYEFSGGKTLEALLAILNSRPGTIFYRILHDIQGKVFAKISLDNLSSFPIPNLEKENEIRLSNFVNEMLSLNKELQGISAKFQRTLQREFSLETLSKKLQNWHELSFAGFLKELVKLKISLSLSQKAEWEDYFLQEQKRALDCQSKLIVTDKEIDQMVYQLYGLTDEEIEIVERQENMNKV